MREVAQEGRHVPKCLLRCFVFHGLPINPTLSPKKKKKKKLLKVTSTEHFFLRKRNIIALFVCSCIHF